MNGLVRVDPLVEPAPLEHEWLRCNFASGAASTAIPKETVSGPIEKSGSAYRTASGEIIEGYGNSNVVGRDENGKLRQFTGEVTDVRKVVVSGSAVRNNKHMTLLKKGGGWIIPESSAFGTELSEAVSRLLKKHGTVNLLPLYEEKGIYNFYLKEEPSPR